MPPIISTTKGRGKRKEPAHPVVSPQEDDRPSPLKKRKTRSTHGDDYDRKDALDVFVSDPAPRKKAKKATPIPTVQILKLDKLDNHHCLITNDNEPSVVIEACHIIRRRLGNSEVENLASLWGIPPRTFNLDTTANLVHLRSDWHLSYDGGFLSFLPTDIVLADIRRKLQTHLKNKTNARYDEICPGKLHEYTFLNFDLDITVPRSSPDGNELQLYYHPYDDFPILTHHSHPYFAIFNTLDKCRHYQGKMPVNVKIKFLELQALYLSWTQLQSYPYVTAPRPPSSPTGRGSMDHSQGSSSSTHSSFQSGPSSPKPRYPLRSRDRKPKKDNQPLTPSLSGKQVPTAYSESHEYVIEWLNGVASFPIQDDPGYDHVISWPDDEVPYPPREKWHDWSPPLNSSDHTLFSSNDHAWRHWLLALPWSVSR